MGNDSTANIATKEILYDGYYYDITSWAKKHPGGSIIELFSKNGDDATIAIKQFHHRASERVMAIMRTLKKRPQETHELMREKTDSAQHQALTEDYMILYNELLNEGYFKGSNTHTLLRLMEIWAYFTFAHYFHVLPSFVWILGLFVLAVGNIRNSYLVHEFGHRSLTGNAKIDKFLQVYVSAFNGGSSAGYWDYMHNRHHAFPQRGNHDVDLNTLPLIAFNKQIIKNEKTANSFFIRNQAYIFHIFDTFLVLIFWKYYLHPKYAFHKRNYVELFLMGLSHYYMYLIGVPAFFISMWLTGIGLFGNFALNHTHTPVTSASESLHWVQYSFEHTVNINPSNLVDWWMGYLNYQIEHHLFPQIPHFRLWKITPRVKAFAEKHGLPYRSLSYFEAVKLNLKNLAQVPKDFKRE